jgi:hypothetical protein
VWVAALQQVRMTMDIAEMLGQSGALDSVARELGVPPGVAAAGAAALLPAILGGFKRQAQQQPNGVEGLGGLLQQMGGGGLLEAVVGPQPTPVEQGNDILGHIFGSRDVSREVAGVAAAQTGINADKLKRMLPMIAMLVAGYLATRSQSAEGQTAPATGSGGLGDLMGGGLGGILGQVLGGALGGGQAPAPASPAGGLGGLASILDLNRDGNPLDDIIGMAGRLRGQ